MNINCLLSVCFHQGRSLVRPGPSLARAERCVLFSVCVLVCVCLLLSFSRKGRGVRSFFLSRFTKEEGPRRLRCGPSGVLLVWK